MTPHAVAHQEPRTKGRLIRWAAGYDLLVRLYLLGREGALRERLLDLARLEPGDAVLDIGCGTGTLAIAAKRRVGLQGSVYGVDAAEEMIRRAVKKASKAGAQVAFEHAIVEALPFPDARFDAVLSTLMLHHLPRPAREQCAREVHRVLKPGGRVLAVDFAGPEERRALLAHLHRHGHVDPRDIIDLFNGARLETVSSGAVGIRNLQYVLATKSHDA